MANTRYISNDTIDAVNRLKSRSANINASNASTSSNNVNSGASKSAYQANMAQPTQTQPRNFSTRFIMGQIATLSMADSSLANQYYQKLQYSMSDPRSDYYNPYNQPTNRAVSNLAALGFDTNNLNDDWWNANQGWVSSNLVYNGTTNTPSSVKKGTRDQKIAYELYQWHTSEETTKKAEQEWQALQEELGYWAMNDARNYSDDYIIDHIDWSKYKTLASMDKDKYIKPTELNRSVGYSRDAMYGVLWAARNDYSGDIWGAMANSALGTGKHYVENPEITAKLNENDDNTYSPYSVGMTLDNEGLYFGVAEFTPETIAELQANPHWDDETWKKNFQTVLDAEDFTVKAEDELTKLNAKVDEWIGNNQYSEEDIVKLLDKYMGKECKTLLEMDKNLKSRTPSAITRAIDYKYDELKQRIHDRVAERDTAPTGMDYTCDEIDAVTTAAPTYHMPGDLDATTGTQNHIASGGMSDAGIKMPSQQERDVFKAQDQELHSGLAAVDGELKPAESTQMKNAGTVSWAPMREIWRQATQLPAAIVGLAQRNATSAAKTYVEGSMASMRFVDTYTGIQSRVESNQQRYDYLHSMLGDIELLNQKIKPSKEVTSGEFKINMQYRAGDPEKGIAPDYVITSAYAPGLGAGVDLYEVLEEPEYYGESIAKQAQNALDEAEKERQQAISDATKVEKAHYVYDSYGENKEALLKEYQSLRSSIERDQNYLTANEKEYNEKAKLLNSVNRNSNLVRSTNHMLGVDTTPLEQAQAVTGYLAQFYDEPQLYNSNESMTQYYDRMFGEAGDLVPYARSEWNKMNIDYIDRQLGYLDMSEEWIKQNDVKLPDNVIQNMKYTRQDLENKKIAYEYASILSDTDPKEMESAIAAGKEFAEKYAGYEHYWTELFSDAGDYYTLANRERYYDQDDGFDRDVVTEEDENLYYYLLGKKVQEMGGSLDEALAKINTDPELTHEAVREVFSDAKKYQQFMEDENTGYGLWSIREYEKSAEYGANMVNSGAEGGVIANAMATGVTPAESIVNAYSALDYAISGKRFNPKSFAGRFSAFKENTRAATRESINKTFGEDTLAGKIANLGYEIYCNRGDSLMNSMVFGSMFHTGVGMIDEFLGASPMGATAAMNAAYEAIENGASTDQAWLIAGMTFFAETATEAVTLSNVKEALGYEGELTKDTLNSVVKNWLTKSGVEEMLGESANDVIENYAQQLAQDLFDNPDYKTDHDNLVDKYVGEGMTTEEAEAAASLDEIKGVMHTALVSYLSAGTEVLMAGGKAAYNSYMTAKTQTKDTDQSAISKMYENWKNRDAKDEVTVRKEEAFAKEQEQREQAEEAKATEQQKEYATDVEVLETAMGSDDASARSSAMAAVLVTETDQTGTNQANAAAVHVEDAFENGAQDVQEILYGGMVNDQNINALKRAIQYAAIGGENSACYQLVQSDEFKAADPAQKASMLGQAVISDMWNAAVNKNAESLIRENRIAEKEKELIANGALQGTQTAEQAVAEADAASRQAQEDLESKQGEAESAAQALDAAVAENNQNPSDDGTKQVIDAATNLRQRDESAQQYEQHKAKLDAALQKAEAACDETKQKEMAAVREQAEQMVNEEDQKIAEEKARIAEQEQIEAEVRQKAFEEQQLNNNISRMDADDFISQYYPDVSEDQKQTIRNAFRQARFEMGYTAQGFLQRKSFANAIEQKFGLKVQVGDTTEGGKVARKNAQINTETGTILLDTNATLDDMFYAIMGHEVTHGAEQSKTYSELADAVLQALYGEGTSYEGMIKAMEGGDLSSQLAQDILAKKRLYDAKVGGDHTYRAMAQEIVADGVGKILSGDQQAMDQLVAQKPNVARRILNSIKNFLRKAAGLEGAPLTQAQQIANLLEQKLKDAGWEGNGEVKYSIPGETTLVADNDGVPLAEEFRGGTVAINPEDIRYSLSSFDENEQERVRQELLKKFPKEQVDKYMDDALGIAALIAADKTRLDFKASDNQVFLKPNNDYYFTLDASTLCAKRLLYQGTFDYVQHALPDEVFTPADLIDLVNIMADMGYETPCGICYVESRRRWLDTYAQKFLDKLTTDPDALVEKYFKKSSEEEKAAMRERFAGEKPTIDDLTTSDGLENLRHTDPYMYRAFVADMNNKGTANPKVVQLRTEYRGDIGKLTAKDIQKVKDIGGLRIQSFSDFETPHLLDMMQAVLDMSSAGLTSQAYTKVPNFAWVFGDTGIKINLSLIGKGTGLDSDGNLVFDNIEGMNFDEAMKLREKYGKNVGTILVGINDDHIVAAMGDPRVDFIIPFHKSGWSDKELKGIRSLNNYSDYTDSQNELIILGKKADGSYETESLKKHKERTKETVENFQPVGKNGYWNFDESGEWNARHYLEMCKDAGRIPKFSQFLVDNGDGSFSLPEGTDKRSTAIREGYWKTLIDFKMYENDSYGRTREDGTKTEVKGSKQVEVTPNINMEEAYRVMGEYKLGRQMPDRPDGTKGRFIPMESNNDVPVATAAGDEYIALIKQRRGYTKPEGPGPDTLEADLPVNPKASAFGASQAPAVLGNTETAAMETGAAQQNAMAINAETGETEQMRYSLPDGTVENAVYIKNGKKANGEEVDFVNEILNGNKKYETRPIRNLRVGEDGWVGITRGGKSAEVVGRVRFGEPIKFQRYESDGETETQIYKDSLINGTIDYDMKAGDTKWAYPVLEIEDFRDNPRPVTKNLPSNAQYRYSLPSDAPYLSAVNHGDMEEAQMAVDNAAENAMKDSVIRNEDGNLMKVYHGTSEQFTVFDMSKGRSTMDIQGSFFSPYEIEAGGYGENVGTYYLDIKNPAPEGIAYATLNKYKGQNEAGKKAREDLISQGYDGVANYDEFIAFYPEQIKSADPVTYDDNGDVIPLSERFQTSNPDIRYSLPSENILNDHIRYYLENQNAPQQAENQGYDIRKSMYSDNLTVRFNRHWTEEEDAALRKIGMVPYNDSHGWGWRFSRGVKLTEDQIREALNSARPQRPQSRPWTDSDVDHIMFQGGQNPNIPVGDIPSVTMQLNPAEQTKQRQWGREGAQQSDELAEQAKQYVLEHNEYYPDTNAEQLDRAIEWIRGNRGGSDADGYYTSMQKVTSSNFNYRSADGQAKMVAVMGMAVARGDVAGQVQLANLYNKQGTTLGQALQARKLWKLMTPEGREQTLVNMLKTSQDDLDAKGTNITLKLSDWVYMAARAATQDGAMEAVQKAAAQEIAQQLPANWRDRFRSWRMLSMLGNPRTHIRNIVGNALFIPAVGLKNKIGAIGEIMSNQQNRTKTLSLFLDKDIRNFAREDAIKMKDTLTGEAKYNENNAVQKEQKAFKGLLQAVIDFNSNKLEQEDWMFLKGHYRRALGGWMQANGYTVEQLQANPSLLEQGRAYAIEEAQKATYRDFNKLAATLNKVSRDGGVAGFIVDATLPFKKTPANILKRGIEYSPVGIMRSLTTDLYHLKQWKDAQNGKLNEIPEKAISPTQFIDRISSGASGSIVLGLGMLLASAGIITCGLDDDDDELEKAKGAQKYAIKILGTDMTFTIDWAAPMSMPLFVGAALQNQFAKEGDFDVEELVDAFGNITEPVFNLSMLDGVNSLFKTSQYDDTNTLTQIGAKIASNYVTSYVPSLFGAIARTIDDKQRKAYVESGKGTGVLGTFRYAYEQTQNKIPGWSQTNIPVRDVWGNANTSGLAERILENFILPGYVNEYKDDPIINEMARLYDLTGDSNMIPSDPNKSVTYNKQKYVLTAEEWDTYKERRGQTAYQYLSELINTREYQTADVITQAQMIKDIWSYADKVGKKAIIPGFKMDDMGGNPVASIAKDTKIDGYNGEMIKALDANDFETYETMIQALHNEGVDDKAIKKKIGDTYRDKYKDAYRRGQEVVMAEIEDILDNTDFDFDYYDWQLQVDKQSGSSGGNGGGGRPMSAPERPTSDSGWGQYMEELDNYWANYDFSRNDPTETNYNGTIDLNDRQVVHNEDGSISTEYSFSFWDDDIGKEVLIPRVVNGRIVSEQEAKRHYYETGEHLGMFDDWHDADEYAMMLHNRNNWYYNR